MSILFTEQDIVSRKKVAVKSSYIEFPKAWAKQFEGKDIVVMPGGNKGVFPERENQGKAFSGVSLQHRFRNSWRMKGCICLNTYFAGLELKKRRN